MSEVNADGVLLNPHEALLQEVQALSNSLMAEKPEGMEDDKEHTVYAANGEPAGTVGGIPHMPTAMAAPPGGHKGAGSGMNAGAPEPKRKAKAPAAAAGRTKKTEAPAPKAEGERRADNDMRRSTKMANTNALGMVETILQERSAGLHE